MKCMFNHIQCSKCIDPPICWTPNHVEGAITASLEMPAICWNVKSGPRQSALFLPLNCLEMAVVVAAPDFCVERAFCLLKKQEDLYCSLSFPSMLFWDLCAFTCVNLEAKVLQRLWDWSLAIATPSHSCDAITVYREGLEILRQGPWVYAPTGIWVNRFR